MGKRVRESERERENRCGYCRVQLLTLPVSESLLDSRFTSFTGLHSQGKINLKQYLEGSEGMGGSHRYNESIGREGKGQSINSDA